jgi:hypothetical protein
MKTITIEMVNEMMNDWFSGKNENKSKKAWRKLLKDVNYEN